MSPSMRAPMVVVLLLALGVSASLDAQGGRQRQTRVDSMTARIDGRVTVAGTSAPVAGAEVRLAAANSYRRLVATDAEGRFDLTNLPAGEYRITVTKAGFSAMQFGQRRPFEASAPIDLSEGEEFTANVVMPRGGVIYGRIVDAAGEPLAGTRVQALRSRTVQGQRRLQSAGVADQTDDLGAFRIYGLPPGEYFVSASPGEIDAARREPPIYFPGTPSFVEALPIRVDAGSEAAADLQLVPIPTATVSGVVLNSSGAPVTAMVALASDVVGLGMSIDGGPPTALRLQADSGRDGRFMIPNVPPGPYTLTAQMEFRLDSPFSISGRKGESRAETEARATEAMLARLPESTSTKVVVSGGDVEGLTLVTRPPASLTLSIEGDSGVTRPLPTGIRVTTMSTHGNNMSMFAGGRDTFRLAGMNGPFHLDVQGVPDDWAVKAITVEGEDVTDRPIDLQGQSANARLVLTDRVSSVGGVVQAPERGARHTVVVFPDDESKWTYPSRYVRVTRTDDQGRFEIKGLPPNERYALVAVDFIEEGEEHDAEVLRELRSRATSFSLNEGERESVWLEPITR
jgi:hypothetical protein